MKQRCKISEDKECAVKIDLAIGENKKLHWTFNYIRPQVTTPTLARTNKIMGPLIGSEVRRVIVANGESNTLG